MQSNNPVLGRAFGSQGSAYQTTSTPSAQELEQMYQTTPAVERDAMTYDDVVAKTGIMLAVLVAGAVVGWQLPGLMMIGLIGGLVLAMVNIFKKEPSPALMLAYAALEGLFVGGISFVFENVAVMGEGTANPQTLDGIVSQAIIGTIGVFAVALWAYKSRRVRVTPKFQRGVMIAMGGYLVFVLVNLAYVWFFSGEGLGFRSGWLGVAIGLFAITLAALVLILNFDSIEKGVQSGIPAKFAWTAAFGLVVTLVWLYVEMLRLLAILQGE